MWCHAVSCVMEFCNDFSEGGEAVMTPVSSVTREGEDVGAGGATVF